MFTFCKSAICPASENLLAFQNGELSTNEFKKIKKHITVCEFCASEVEFYAHYPQAEEEITPIVEIPIPLYDLALALLNNKHKDFSLLNQLLVENEAVKI